MRHSELIDILQTQLEARGDKELTAGQMKTPDGALVLTVVMPNGTHAPAEGGEGE